MTVEPLFGRTDNTSECAGSWPMPAGVRRIKA